MLAFASSIILAAAQAASADQPGKAVYEQYCAACHNLPATRAPALAALQQMSAQTLRFTLTEGIMRQQGSAVPREQFQQLISYLAAPDTGGDWVAGMMCKPDQRAVDLSQPDRDVDDWHRRSQQPALERTTGGTHEQGSRQSRARVGHRVSEDRSTAHVRSDRRLDDVLRAGTDRQSARTRHAQCLREVGLRRRRAAALVAFVRRARQHRQDGARFRRRSRQRSHRRCEDRRADLESRSASRCIRRHHRRAGARRQSHRRADLLIGRRSRRRSEIRMLRRSRRSRRARREHRSEAVDCAHDGGREVHRQGQRHGREAARSIGRADLVDTVRRRQTRPRLLGHAARQLRCPRPTRATQCSRSISRPAS